MDLEEYRNALKSLEDYVKKAKAKISFEYATSNNPYKLGDIITDGSNRIKIEKADVRISTSGIPTCVFRGPLVKKDGEQYQNGKWEEVWQTNIEK